MNYAAEPSLATSETRQKLSIGDRISRRMPQQQCKRGVIQDHLYKRRGEDVEGLDFLTIEQIATFARDGRAGYFCRDKNGLLHFVETTKIVMVYL